MTMKHWCSSESKQLCYFISGGQGAVTGRKKQYLSIHVTNAEDILKSSTFYFNSDSLKLLNFEITVFHAGVRRFQEVKRQNMLSTVLMAHKNMAKTTIMR